MGKSNALGRNGRVMNVHALLAVGISRDGHRVILGVDGSSGEDKAGWLTFFRGLTGVKLVTSSRPCRLCGVDWGDTAWCIMATLSNALCGELDVDHP